MFSAYQHATRAYRDIGLETGATGARPLDLIVMLYDGAIDALTQAIARFAANDQIGRQQAIARAVRILDEGLSASLDPSGGEITSHLRELYGYMTRRTLHASLTADPAPLEEVRKLLKDLRGAWAEIATQPSTGLTPPSATIGARP